MAEIPHAVGWQQSAACRQADPEIFFDPSQDNKDSSGSPVRHLRRAAAKEFCASCPVVSECLREHIDEPFGVFGGMDQDERAVLRSQKVNMRPADQRRIGKSINDLRQQGVSWSDCSKSVSRTVSETQRLHSIWINSPEGRAWVMEERVVTMYRDGTKMHHIAQRLKLQPERVARIVEAAGLRVPPHTKVPQEMQETIIEMSEAGATVVRIAQSTGVPEARVYAIVKEYRLTKHAPPVHHHADAWVLEGSSRVAAEYLGESDEERPMYFLRMLGRDQTRRWVPGDKVKFTRPVSPIKMVRAGAERTRVAATETRRRVRPETNHGRPGLRAEGDHTPQLQRPQ